MSKPTHIAYVVIPPKEGSDKKPVWREVGHLAAHEGQRFDLVIVDQVSVTGPHRLHRTQRRRGKERRAGRGLQRRVALAGVLAGSVRGGKYTQIRGDEDGGTSAGQ